MSHDIHQYRYHNNERLFASAIGAAGGSPVAQVTAIYGIRVIRG